MPTTTNPQSVHQARIAAVVVLITASFGALWDLLGAAALPGTPSSVAALLTIVVTTAFLLAAARLLLLSRRLPRSSASAGTNPFRSRAYLLAVLFEVVAIVGLHFFGLVPAFKSRRFAAVGGAMVLVGLLSLLLPSVAGGASGVNPRGAATDLGSALVFWVGVLSLVISAWLGPTFDPTEPKGRFGGVWRPPIPPTAS